MESCLGPFLSNIYSKDCFILSYLLKFYKVAEAMRSKGRYFNSEEVMENAWLVDGERTLILGCEKDRNPEYTLPIWLLPDRDSPLRGYWLCLVRTLSCAKPIAQGHVGQA